MIARALVMNPSIVIMDEATTAIDIETRRKVWDFLLKLNREKGVTILRLLKKYTKITVNYISSLFILIYYIYKK